jgi:hypothetical protein
MQLLGRDWSNRQRDDLDAFFAQLLDFLPGCLAANRALGRLAVVNLSRLFRETLAHVFGMLEGVLDDFGAQPGHELRPTRHSRFFRWLGPRQVYVGRAGELGDRGGPAHGTEHMAARVLMLKRLGRGEPAFELMCVVAGKVVNDHFGGISSSRWSSPESMVPAPLAQDRKQLTFRPIAWPSVREDRVRGGYNGSSRARSTELAQTPTAVMLPLPFVPLTWLVPQRDRR